MELGQADEVLIAGLESFQPFGHQHPTPVWATRGVSVVGTPRIVGQGHLKMRVAAGGVERDCIGFNLGGHPVPEGRIDIAYQVKMNSFRSRESVQLTLKDFRAG
jgi:single-stranded-DNA-specific exonuclease